MELLEGGTLGSKLAGTPLRVEEALGLAEQMAMALAELHAEGLIHRDLKPANVMFTACGEVRLVDFGLARHIEPTEDSRITASGDLLGSLDYLAPEQVIGEKVDERTDLFALGVILYEMLSGRLPFEGESPLGRASARLRSTTPDLRRHRREVPGWLVRMVSRLLERNPEDRYDSAGALLHDLRARSGNIYWRKRFNIALRRGAMLAGAFLFFVAFADVARWSSWRVEHSSSVTALARAAADCDLCPESLASLSSGMSAQFRSDLENVLLPRLDREPSSAFPSPGAVDSLHGRTTFGSGVNWSAATFTERLVDEYIRSGDPFFREALFRYLPLIRFDLSDGPQSAYSDFNTPSAGRFGVIGLSVDSLKEVISDGNLSPEERAGIGRIEGLIHAGVASSVRRFVAQIDSGRVDVRHDSTRFPSIWWLTLSRSAPSDTLLHRMESLSGEGLLPETIRRLKPLQARAVIDAIVLSGELMNERLLSRDSSDTGRTWVSAILIEGQVVQKTGASDPGYEISDPKAQSVVAQRHTGFLLAIARRLAWKHRFIDEAISSPFRDTLRLEFDSEQEFEDYLVNIGQRIEQLRPGFELAVRYYEARLDPRTGLPPEFLYLPAGADPAGALVPEMRAALEFITALDLAGHHPQSRRALRNVLAHGKFRDEAERPRTLATMILRPRSESEGERIRYEIGTLANVRGDWGHWRGSSIEDDADLMETIGRHSGLVGEEMSPQL
jgi:serine/threonine protein kinase